MSVNIGDKFTNCPEGFKRYVYNQSKKDNFYMNKMTSVRSWGVFGINEDDVSVTFYVKNATEIRCISLIEATCGVQNVYVNDKLYGEYYSTFTNTPYSSITMGYDLVSTIIYPTTEYTKVQILNNGSKKTQLNFEGIDINENAELITKEEFEEAIKVCFILKDNGIYKTYNKDSNVLDIIPDISTLDPSVLTNVVINELQNALSLLPSLENIKLIISKNNKINLSAIKNTNELVVMRNDFYTSQISTINSIFTNNMLSGSGVIKLAVSVDNGLSWKTYIGGTWSTLSIVIPQNKYSSLTSDEKLLWDNALNEIYTNGIDSTVISSIDFNTLNAEKLRFAVVLNNENYSDVVKLENIICNAKQNDYLKECSKSEVEQMLIGNVIKLKSNISTDKLVVNISTTGITTGSAFDYNSAENKPILNNKTLQGIMTLDEIGIASKSDIDTLSSRIDVLTGDKQTYKGYYATETDRDLVIISPEEGDFCVVDSSEDTDTAYNGKTIKYTFQDGRWQILAIVKSGEVLIDDADSSTDKTWSSEKIYDELDKKQSTIGKYELIIDSSQFVKVEDEDYKDWYSVTITHNLGCGSNFNIRALNLNNQPCNLCVVFDDIANNSFNLYSLEKQTLKINVIAI